MDFLGDISIHCFAGFIVAGFVAGYIDAIAGGGGMIQALVLLAGGIPPINTLATNKMVSFSGTVTAIFKYALNKKINWFLALACLVPCGVVAAIGAKLIMCFSNDVVTWLILLSIPVALVFMLLKNNQYGEQDESKDRKKALVITIPIAFYDGFVGPGAGTYWAIAANRFLKMSYLRATAFAKPINASTNIGALVIYIFAGKVIWTVAVPMAFFSFIGAYIGSNSAMKRGDGFIKKIMIGMLVTMIFINIFKLLK